MTLHTSVRSEHTFTLTPEQQAEMEKLQSRFTDLDRIISDAQAEKDRIKQKLEAVALLTGVVYLPSAQKAAHASEPEDGEPEMPMIDATEQIVLTAESTLSKTELKKRLRAAGYGESRLGNYFYTVIARLKKNNRIKVLRNGDVTRPDPEPETRNARADLPQETLAFRNGESA